MRNIDEYLQKEESAIREEIENILRNMCFGMSHREWSDDMIDKLYKDVYCIIESDLDGQDEDIDRLTVTEEMVITAMMMHIDNNECVCENMNTKQAVDVLLSREQEISGKFHNAILEILRLGWESDRGKQEINSLIESIEYSLEDMQRILNR